MLHELAHIKNRASLLRISAHVARLLSPLSALANFLGNSTVSQEEESADGYAALVQGTSEHLASAKEKMISYNRERSG